jgi:hypothetical protein
MIANSPVRSFQGFQMDLNKGDLSIADAIISISDSSKNSLKGFKDSLTVKFPSRLIVARIIGSY